MFCFLSFSEAKLKTCRLRPKCSKSEIKPFFGFRSFHRKFFFFLFFSFILKDWSFRTKTGKSAFIRSWPKTEKSTEKSELLFPDKSQLLVWKYRRSQKNFDWKRFKSKLDHDILIQMKIGADWNRNYPSKLLFDIDAVTDPSKRFPL